MLDPRLLDGGETVSVTFQPFDGRDFGAVQGRDREDARSSRGPVDVHGARPAGGDTATELGAPETDFVPNHPKERHVWRGVDGDSFSIQDEGDFHGSTSYAFADEG